MTIWGIQKMSPFHEYSGQLVTLTTADGQVFKGIVCSLDDNSGKIVLKNASMNGLKLPGLQNFFVSNVKELSLTKQLQASRASDEQRRGAGRHITPLSYDHHGVKPHLRKLLKFDSDQLVRSHCMAADTVDQGIGSGEDNDNFEDFYEEENYSVFCQTCDKFRESIICLMQQSVIAVAFCGTGIGRKGTLSLIQVATENDIYVYDIQRLGMEGFVDGLQTVLESTTVLKIIHDCRMVSDLLYHQFQVSLANVFDTQVASAFVFRCGNDGNWPRFVESLPGVLMSHLGLTNEDVHHFFVRERLKQRDEEVWLQRPLCTQLVKDSLKNLTHMISLYRVLQTKLFAEFHVGVQLYLDQVRNSPEHKVESFSSSSHLLPFVFQDIPKLTKHNSVYTYVRVKYEGSHGFVDTCPRSGPNMVTTSRDSIWHSKSRLGKASCKCECKKATRPMTDNNETHPSDNTTHGLRSPSSQSSEFANNELSRKVGDNGSSTAHDKKTICAGSQTELNFPPPESDRSAHPSSFQSDRTSSSSHLKPNNLQSSASPMNQAESNSHHSPSSKIQPESNLHRSPSSMNQPKSESLHSSSSMIQPKSNLHRSPSSTNQPKSESHYSPSSTKQSELHSHHSPSSSSSSMKLSKSKLFTINKPKVVTQLTDMSSPVASTKPTMTMNHKPTLTIGNGPAYVLKTQQVNDISGSDNLTVRKSALWKLPTSQSPGSCVNQQSERVIKDTNCDGQVCLGDQDVDTLYDCEVVKKVLKQARKQHSAATDVKTRFLLPSKSKELTTKTSSVLNFNKLKVS